MIIGSYMDESFDYKQTGTFVVGGILGRSIAVFELERRWEKLQTRPDIDIKYFKASECHNGLGQFAKFVREPKNITLAQEAFQNLKVTNPNAAQYMTTFSSADEKKCAPLQAADAGVFEVRRALNLALKKWDGELRSQFNLLADGKAMFLITHSNKEQ